MASVGRPKAGLDYCKYTLRVSQEQDEIVSKYCRDHEKPEPSTAIRAAIDLLGDSINLSDNIETSCANLLDIAKAFDNIDGDNAPVYSQAIREATALLWTFCYKNHLPDKKQLEETRRKKDERFIKQMKRGKNNVGQNEVKRDKAQ